MTSILSTTNKDVVRLFLEAIFNTKSISVIDSLANIDFLNWFISPQARQSIAEFLPNLYLTIEHIIAEENRVTVIAIFSSSNQGILFNGQPLKVKWIEVFYIDDCKVVGSSKPFELSLLMQGNGKEALIPVQANSSPNSSEEEPVLEIKEIQGNILSGFKTDFQILLCLQIIDLDSIKDWLNLIQPRITTAAEVLSYRNRQGEKANLVTQTWLNIAFSYHGLTKLNPEDALLFTDPAFKEGMHNRFFLLGDPIQENAEGTCTNWVIGSPNSVPDILLIIASDNRESLIARVAQLESELNRICHIIFKQEGATLSPPLIDHEHFGFKDGISQPGLRGRLANTDTDFLTLRQNPNNPNQGKPGQNLIWPGEFIFGYPGQKPTDKLRAGSVSTAGPSWDRNGSFLVFRRLRQDVEGFHSYLVKTAHELAKQHPELSDLTPEKLGAKFMGRWTSGAPLLRSPDADNSCLAKDTCANNHFTYISPNQSVSIDETRQNLDETDLPTSAGDALGLICPHAAHIRRAYPRDATTADFSEANIETHRLLRRAIPFGDPFPAPGDRGLLFLAYQTSFERQFEFVTRAWLNNPNFPDSGDGHDPIVGQNFESQDKRFRKFTLPIRSSKGNLLKITLNLPNDWVIPTGGGYFFVPAISALQYLYR